MMFTISKSRFKKSHYLFGHETYFTLSDSLTTLYECCNTCELGIPVKNFEIPKNIHLLICKSQREYSYECCNCETVIECRNKHNCCCTHVLDEEIEQKRLEEKERQAKKLLENDPELANMICKTKDKVE